MKPLFAALRFLSILPVRQSWAGKANELANSVKFFPVVGLIMGAIVVSISWALGFVMPQFALAAIVVVGLIVLTRGFHVDGLADTADGFWSVSNSERILEIMKDSHVGAMGVIAIVSVMLLKFACLAFISNSIFRQSLLLMVITGRCMMVLPISMFPYARKEGGLGQLFYEKRSPLNVIWSVAAVLVVGWFLFGFTGIVVGIGAVVATVLFCFYCKFKIGGVTGDTIGATCEIAEVITVLIICMIVQR